MITRAQRINNDKFITAWLQFDSVSDVAKAMNMSEKSARAKAWRLRKQGITLPYKQRGRTS